MDFLVRVYFPVMKTRPKLHGEVMVYLAYTASVSQHRSQDNNSNRPGPQRQELMQRPWTSGANWHVPCGLFSLFLIELRTNRRRVMPVSHNRLGPPTSKTN